MSVVCTSPSYGLIDTNNGVGARVLGLGRGFAGLANDTNAIFINPAGIASLSNFTFTNMYASPMEDIGLFSLGATFPSFLNGVAGLGYNQSTLAKIPLTTLETVDYSSQSIYLSYACQLNPALALGFNLKYLQKGYTQDVYRSTSGHGQDLDLALKYTPFPWFGLGLNLQNILPASLGGKFVYKDGSEEGIQHNFKLGTSFKVWGRDSLYEFSDQTLYLNLDVDKTTDLPSLLHFGVEWQPTDNFAFRSGLDQATNVLGTQVYTNIALGFGIKRAGFTFDYTYYVLAETSKRADQYFSIGYVGQEKEEPYELLPATEEVDVRPTLIRKHFKDVPDNHWAREPIETLAALGLIAGFPDGSFRPNRPVTRAEICAILFPAANESEEQFFSDVPPNFWAAAKIEQAVQKKIVAGYPDGSFKPNKKVTHLEGVVILARYAGLPLKRVLENPYPDLPGRLWAAPYVNAAKEAGLLDFLGERFYPKRALTRSEMAAMLFRTADIKNKLATVIIKDL